MTSRARALITLVASAALVVAAGIAWASTSSGVGTNLARTGPEQASPSQASETSAEDMIASTGSSAAAASDPSSDAPGESLDLPDVPVVDATEIVIPDDIPPPQSLRMGSVGVTMPVVATGVAADGQMELPDDPAILGWYRFGAAPGDASGSAVLAGHVDSLEYGVGPLTQLANVAVGETITIKSADGTPVRYRVTDVARIKQTALPLDEIFRPDGDHQLVVVTCGGRYLPDAGGYEDNIVVTAQPVAV